MSAAQCNLRDNQVRAWGMREIPKKIPEVRFLGILIKKEKIVPNWEGADTANGDLIGDDETVHRQFACRFKLLKATNILSTRESRLMLFLVDHKAMFVDLASAHIDVHLNPELTSPVADLVLQGYGKRYGVLQNYLVASATLTFKDEEQGRVLLKTVTVPVERTKETVIHHHRDKGFEDDLGFDGG